MLRLGFELGLKFGLELGLELELVVVRIRVGFVRTISATML